MVSIQIVLHHNEMVLHHKASTIVEHLHKVVLITEADHHNELDHLNKTLIQIVVLHQTKDSIQIAVLQEEMVLHQAINLTIVVLQEEMDHHHKAVSIVHHKADLILIVVLHHNAQVHHQTIKDSLVVDHNLCLSMVHHVITVDLHQTINLDKVHHPKEDLIQIVVHLHNVQDHHHKVSTIVDHLLKDLIIEVHQEDHLHKTLILTVVLHQEEVNSVDHHNNTKINMAINHMVINHLEDHRHKIKDLMVHLVKVETNLLSAEDLLQITIIIIKYPVYLRNRKRMHPLLFLVSFSFWIVWKVFLLPLILILSFLESLQ
jgi:hypothetical protein